MLRLPARGPRNTGFTLMELIVVMVLLGIIAGLGVASYDRFDPGNRAVLSSAQTFLESSRDQARVSGHPVTIEVRQDGIDGSDRLLRWVQRTSLEATFEPIRQAREGVIPEGAAAMGALGRFGAALDLREGGLASIGDGRSIPDTSHGYVLEFHYLDLGAGEALLFEWDDLISIRTGPAGDLVLQVNAGEGQYFSDARIDVPPGSLEPERWHLVQVRVQDASVQVKIDGRQLVVESIPPEFGRPSESPRFGDPDDTFQGLIDEFVFRTRVRENGPEFRGGIRALFGVPQIVLDRHGLLDSAVHQAGVPVELQEFDETFASFVVGRFTEEVQP